MYTCTSYIVEVKFCKFSIPLYTVKPTTYLHHKPTNRLFRAKTKTQTCNNSKSKIIKTF